MARIGIYGGSFNPPHSGHSLAAQEIVEKLALDKLLIIPAAVPPHKELSKDSPSAEDRLMLCRLAFSALPKVEVCDLEIRREGFSYTVDTLTEIHRQHPLDELYLVMGTDMLLSFDTWRAPDQISSMAILVVMKRVDDDAVWDKVLIKCEKLKEQFQSRIVQIDNQFIQISSTSVRRLLAFGTPAYLDPKVKDAILKHSWYLSGEQMKNLPFDRLKEEALALHDPKRRAHAQGCCETARELAVLWGCDPDKAARAGILHDITKALGPKEQLLMSQRYHIPLSDLQRENPKMLHAKTGAFVAETVFGESEEVCDAIRWHTTGKAGMTVLEKIIYLADYMEPNRNFPGVELLRKSVTENLDKAMYQGLDFSVTLLRKQGRIIDTDSLSALSYYKNLLD